MVTKDKAVIEPIEEAVEPEATSEPPANPLKGFVDVRIGGELKERVEMKVGADGQIVQKGTGQFDFIGTTLMPARRVPGTTNEYDLYLEDDGRIVRVKRGDPLQRAMRGEIPNPLAQIILRLTAASKKISLREQIKVEPTAAEQAEMDAAHLEYAGHQEDIIIAMVIAACEQPIFYDDRSIAETDEPLPRDPHPRGALPLTLTISNASIRSIFDFLQTGLDRFRPLFH